MYDITPVTSEKQTDCGATCLKMLLAYYGQDVDLDTLISECNTRLIGCSAGDIKRVGNAHGLDIYVYQMDADELLVQDRPAIIHWKHGHWCVYCGFNDEGKAVIINPDRGKFGMDKAIFKTMYSGVAIFNGEPVDSPEAGGQTISEKVDMLTECLLEISQIIYG